MPPENPPLVQELKRIWFAAKIGERVVWWFPFTGETGGDVDKWSGYGVLIGTRDPNEMRSR